MCGNVYVWAQVSVEGGEEAVGGVGGCGLPDLGAGSWVLAVLQELYVILKHRAISPAPSSLLIILGNLGLVGINAWGGERKEAGLQSPLYRLGSLLCRVSAALQHLDWGTQLRYSSAGLHDKTQRGGFSGMLLELLSSLNGLSMLCGETLF